MNDEKDKSRLEVVLAAYGADPARWPEDERISLLLEVKEIELEQQTREAKEIDFVLGAAHAPAMPHGAIERLMSKTNSGTQKCAEIVELSARRAAPPRPMVLEFLPAGVAIAACLLLGVFIGTSQFAEQYLPVGSMVAANEADFQDDGILDLNGDGFEDGEVL
ncbi:MAG: hypothetical protein ACR2OR_04210 [Hyphomicrobiales bacterium]